MIVMKVNDMDVKFATISDLAVLCKKKPTTLRKMEQLGVLPSANFRAPDVKTSNGYRPGARIYSYEMAVEVARVIREEITQGIAVTQDTRQKLQELFRNERLKYKLDA